MTTFDSVSCAEVLLLKNGNLIVCCTLCEAEYFPYLEYVEHVEVHHSLNVCLANTESVVKDLSPNRSLTEETYMPLVSEDDFKMFDELEFIAPEPTNCREIEDFVISYNNKEHERNQNSIEASPIAYKRKLKKKQPPGRRRKYKCQRCDFVTLYLSSMRCHIQRHDGIRLFNCPQCEKAFYTQTEVENHLRTHTGFRPYLCTTCGQTYVTSFALWRHRKSCNNIRDKECTLCDAKFADTRCLRDHLTTHSNVRDFQCSICKASFKLKKALLSHIKIHENKREYKCKLCSASFNQAPSLSSHMKSKH